MAIYQLCIPYFTKAAVFILSIVIGGCAAFQVGSFFETSNISRLKLGKTSISEYRTLFGEPMENEQRSKVYGTFELVTFGYGGFGGIKALVLEFRNGLLNSYIYQDSAQAYTDHLAGLSKLLQMNKSTKANVLLALGAPNGKGLFPNTLGDFKDKAKPGAAEIWTWIGAKKINNINILFNSAEMVIDVDACSNFKDSVYFLICKDLVRRILVPKLPKNRE